MKDKLSEKLFLDCYNVGFLLKENKIDKVAILRRFPTEKIVRIVFFYDGKVRETVVPISEEECKSILHATGIKYLKCRTKTEAEYFVLYDKEIWTDIWVKVLIENKESYYKRETTFWTKENYYYLPKIDAWLLYYTASFHHHVCPICGYPSYAEFHQICEEYDLLSTEAVMERLVNADRSPSYDWKVEVLNEKAYYSEKIEELKPFIAKYKKEV